MIIQKLPSIASGVLTISNVAKALRDAIRAADSPTSSSFEFLNGANLVYLTVDTNNVRYSFDGNAPTATQGALSRAGDFILLAGIDLEKLQFIRQGSGDVTLTVVAIAKQDELSGDPIAMSPAATVTVDTEFPTAAAITDNFANPTTTSVMAMNMLWDGATWDRAPGDATNGQLVNLGANNDITVTGSVTANAGTNLNTSALALETGGNLATIAGDTTSIDGKIPAKGTALMAASTPITLATDDVLSIATHAQDSAVGATDRGIPGLSKRVTTLAAVTPAAGDYVFEQVDDNGAKWIKEGYAPQAEDNTNGVIATQNRPLAVSTYAWSTDNSAALEASTVTKASAGTLRSVAGRINSTHASGTYYIQCINAASLPADGAVTLLRAPLKIIHTLNTDSNFSIDCTDNGLYASTGIVIDISTTEWTKTISGAFLSTTVLFK